MKSSMILYLILFMGFVLLEVSEESTVLIVGKSMGRLVSKKTAKDLFKRKFPDYKFDPAVVKKGSKKEGTKKLWKPHSEMELQFPPHLFPKGQKS